MGDDRLDSHETITKIDGLTLEDSNLDGTSIHKIVNSIQEYSVHDNDQLEDSGSRSYPSDNVSITVPPIFEVKESSTQGDSTKQSQEEKPVKRKPTVRAKVPFEKGYSQMDWLKLTRTAPDLAELPELMFVVQLSLLRFNGASEKGSLHHASNSINMPTPLVLLCHHLSAPPVACYVFASPHLLRFIVSEPLAEPLELRGLKGQSNRRLISIDEVRQHKTEGSVWTVLKGCVFNISPYMKFHPGGENMLMKAAGKDCTSLFNKYHAWVNAEFLLEKCLVGVLDASE